MRSAHRMVEKRWAMMTMANSPRSLSMTSWIRLSLSVSMELVASSSSKSNGFRSKALAKLIDVTKYDSQLTRLANKMKKRDALSFQLRRNVRVVANLNQWLRQGGTADHKGK